MATMRVLTMITHLSVLLLLVFLLLDITSSFPIVHDGWKNKNNNGNIVRRSSFSSTTTSSKLSTTATMPVPRFSSSLLLSPPVYLNYRRTTTSSSSSSSSAIRMILSTTTMGQRLMSSSSSSSLQSLSTKSSSVTSFSNNGDFGGGFVGRDVSTKTTSKITTTATATMLTTIAILIRSIQVRSESFTRLLLLRSSSMASQLSSLSSLLSFIQERCFQHGQQLRRVWWTCPLILALFPIYCTVAMGTCATMPDWWQVVNMEYIATAHNAHWVIVPFLASNISYFWSGIYLMTKFNLINVVNNVARPDASSSGEMDGTVTTTNNHNNNNNNIKKRLWGGLRVNPNRFAMLGVWVWLAGLISTVFHSVQALGSHSLAESLCYIDHAVAMSAILYFIDTCGIPSKSVSLIGALAILTLVITPTPGYAWLHSTWHYLSAFAATKWALEGYYNYRRHNHQSSSSSSTSTSS